MTNTGATAPSALTFVQAKVIQDAFDAEMVSIATLHNAGAIDHLTRSALVDSAWASRCARRSGLGLDPEGK